METLRFEIGDSLEVPAATEILNGLVGFNEAQGFTANRRDLIISVKLGDKVVGGLKAQTHWGWLYVSQLWVAESHRAQGLGSKLLKSAEAEAIERQCRHSYLDTFSFQALGFYQKNGYQVFGELADFPKGKCRYFLKKDLPID